MPPIDSATDSDSISGSVSDVKQGDDSSASPGVLNDGSPSSPTSDDQSGGTARPAQSLDDAIERALTDAPDSSPAEQDAEKPDADTGDPNPKTDKSKSRAGDDKTPAKVDGADPAEKPGKAKSTDDIPREFAKHPAWQRLKRERDEARAEAVRQRESRQSPDPELKQVIGAREAAHAGGLDDQDITDAVTLAVALRNEPEKALKAMESIVEGLRQNLGEKLDPDLQQAVDAGSITEAYAKELSKARSAAKRAEGRAGEIERRTTAERVAESAKQRKEGIRSAVSTWETDKLRSDPDFKRFQGRIFDQVRALEVARKRPIGDGADAVALAEEAYKILRAWAEESFSAPPPRAIKGQIPHTGKATGGTAARSAPKNLMEAIDTALE